MPAAVVIPANQDDVVALVRQAAESHLALIPRGAGSGMPGGNVGSGVIVDAEGQGTDARVQVNFGKGGMKWLAVAVAKLQAA